MAKWNVTGPYAAQIYRGEGLIYQDLYMHIIVVLKFYSIYEGNMCLKA